MKIIRFSIFQFFILYTSFELVRAGFDCELREKLNRGIRALDRNNRRGDKKPIKEFFQNLKMKLSKRNPQSALDGLAKNIEVILSRIIPNHNLVQDLMGYVTMSRPDKNHPLVQFHVK